MDMMTNDFARLHPDAFARVLLDATPAEITAMCNALPPATAAGVAARLPATVLGDMLNSGAIQPALWLGAGSTDDAIELLGRIPEERRLALVNGLPDRTRRRRLQQFLNYPPHSIGALASDSMLRFRQHTPIGDVLAELRRAPVAEQPAVVLDDASHYLGVLATWRMLTADPLVGEAGDYVITVEPMRPEVPLESAGRARPWRDHNWLPIVDHSQHVLGWVSRARMLENIDESDELSPASAPLIDLADAMFRVEADLLGNLIAAPVGN